MYDAVDVAALPGDGDLYAGYIDGNYVTVPALRQRFPNKPIVEVAVRTGTNAGHVFDTEPGNPEPPAAARWVAMRRASGLDTAGIYTMRSWWGWCIDALNAVGIDPNTVPFWIADATGREHELAGAIATQWLFHGDWDLSNVADHWPGVDSGSPSPKPKFDTGVLGMFCRDQTTGTIWWITPGGVVSETDPAVVARKEYVGSPYAGDMHPLQVIQWAQNFHAWDYAKNDFIYLPYGHNS